MIKRMETDRDRDEKRREEGRRVRREEGNGKRGAQGRGPEAWGSGNTREERKLDHIRVRAQRTREECTGKAEKPKEEHKKKLIRIRM